MPKEALREHTNVKNMMPKRYKVLFYNDDFTPMEFVVAVLEDIFDKNYEEAVELMMSVHTGTYAVVGVYTKDIAKTKTARAVEWARREGYPLKIEAVEE